MAIYMGDASSGVFNMTVATPASTPGGGVSVPGMPNTVFDVIPGMPYQFQTAAPAPVKQLGKAKAANVFAGSTKVSGGVGRTGLATAAFTRSPIDAAMPAYLPKGGGLGAGVGGSSAPVASPIPSAYVPPAPNLPQDPVPGSPPPSIQMPPPASIAWDQPEYLGPVGSGGTGPTGDRSSAVGEAADQSEFAVKLPTWAIVAGAIAVTGLGAFALHRALPGKRR